MTLGIVKKIVDGHVCGIGCDDTEAVCNGRMDRNAVKAVQSHCVISTYF